MILILAAAMAIPSNIPPPTWEMGGGRSWMSRPGRTSSAIPPVAVGFATAFVVPLEPGDAINGRAWLVPPKVSPCLPNGYCFTEKELREAEELRETKAAKEAVRKAVERVADLAKHGKVGEMADYGYLLLNGIGVARDEVAAMGWFYEAAQKDDGMSMYALGCGFKNGVGVAADPKLAAFWQDRAAKKGFTKPC